MIDYLRGYFLSKLSFKNGFLDPIISTYDQRFDFTFDMKNSFSLNPEDLNFVMAIDVVCKGIQVVINTLEDEYDFFLPLLVITEDCKVSVKLALKKKVKKDEDEND